MSEDAGDADKPNMPQVFKELGEKAIRRHERRSATPALKLELSGGKWWFGSPFNSDADDQWTALMFDAFATRSQATFRTFMIQLAELCSSDWDKEADAWHPNEDELMAAVQVVRSVRPRNEAQACLAAQMVAVHLMQMKLSAKALNGGYPEPRSCAIAGKLARTYAMQLETMAKLKGKGTRQRITVRKTSTHEHKHIHLHQGDIENGDQPHGPRGARAAEIKTIGEPENGAALLGSNTAGNALSVPGNQIEAPVSSPRLRLKVGSANGKR
jgi:hypothetical protein